MRGEGINPNLYYRLSKSFLEAGKKRLSGDTQREATTDEVVVLRRENEDLKKLLADTEEDEYQKRHFQRAILTGSRQPG